MGNASARSAERPKNEYIQLPKPALPYSYPHRPLGSSLADVTSSAGGCGSRPSETLLGMARFHRPSLSSHPNAMVAAGLIGPINRMWGSRKPGVSIDACFFLHPPSLALPPQSSSSQGERLTPSGMHRQSRVPLLTYMPFSRSFPSFSRSRPFPFFPAHFTPLLRARAGKSGGWTEVPESVIRFAWPRILESADARLISASNQYLLTPIWQ